MFSSCTSGLAQHVAAEREVGRPVAHKPQDRGHEVELLGHFADLAPQRAVGRVDEPHDVVAARKRAGLGRELLRRHMIGHEDKDRATEPLLAAETLEEAAKGPIVVGHAFVDARVALGQRRRVALRHHERVVRRKGEERAEEGLRRFREFFPGELQELLVPDAPVAVEIGRAVGRLVVFAAHQPLDPRRAGIGPDISFSRLIASGCFSG